MKEFLSMGDYGVYVWPAFGVFLLVVALDFIAPRLRRRRILKEIRAQLRRHNKQRGS